MTTPTRLLAPGLLVLALLAATLGAAAPAGAESRVLRDPAGDVVRHAFSDEEGPELPGTALPERREGDLRRVVVRHGEHRLRVRLGFRELRRGSGVLALQARLTFPTHGSGLDVTEATIVARKANRRGRARLSTFPGCAVRHRIDYAADVATMSFPTRCLGTPDWVRANAWALRLDSWRRPTTLLSDPIWSVFSKDQGSDLEQFSARIPRG